MPTELTLRQKLVEIRKSVPYLQKASKNEQQGFSYTSSSQVITAVRAKMDELNIALIPAITGHATQPSTTGKQMLTELTMEYTVIDCDSGETIIIPWYAQGTDVHEKGVGKALTYGEKYFLLKLFQIPTDKDYPDAWAEKVAGDSQTTPSEVKKPRPARATQTAPPDDTGTIGAGAIKQLVKALGDAGIDEAAFVSEWGFRVDEVPKAKLTEVMIWAKENRSTTPPEKEGDIFDV